MTLSFGIFSQITSPDRDLLSAMGRALSHQAVEVRRVAASALGHVLHSKSAQLPNDLLKVCTFLSIFSSKAVPSLKATSESPNGF